MESFRRALQTNGKLFKLQIRLRIDVRESKIILTNREA